jgi:hypothetical protein
MEEVMERPNIFDGEMVRAILDGRKTQTRLVRPQPSNLFLDKWVKCPCGKPGDTLWVRETWSPIHDRAIRYRADKGRRDFGDPNWEHHEELTRWWDKLQPPTRERWFPSIHMPRWASRITLNVKAIRVEQLKDISEEDAQAEGVDALPVEDIRDPRKQTYASYVYPFSLLWDSINAKRGFGWGANPWVWVVEFERMS